MHVTSTWDSSASDTAPAEEPRAEATAPAQAQAPAAARPHRRPTEVHSISQLTTDEILAELDRRERRTRQLLSRQEVLRAELSGLEQQLADIGDSLPELEAAARALPASRASRAGAEAAEPAAPRTRRRSGPRARNALSLADAIAAAVEVRAQITPAEAAELVRSNGYVTNASKFTMTVANALAKDNRFRRLARGVYERIA
jgi:hypothetical protein